MELTFEKLIKFDLEKDLEKELTTEGKHEQVIQFLNIFYEIVGVDKFIRECPSSPGSTNKIIRNEMISAIGSTLAIEGGNLRPEEIEESFNKAQRKEVLERNEQEAENSRKVYEFIIGITANHTEVFVYTESIVKQIHKFFTDGLNYLGNVPGQYRGEFVTKFGYPPRSGLCRNGTEVGTAMRNFADWLNDESKEGGLFTNNMIVKAIMAHYYLTEIHPFADGNGRTARALEALILYVNRINQYCFWSLANFWSVNRGKYIQQLGEIRYTCNPWNLLVWGMEGYLQEIKRIKGLVLKKVKELMFMDYSRYLWRKAPRKISSRFMVALELLLRSGRVPLDVFHGFPEVKALYSNVSAATKSRDFRKMSDLKLINITSKDNKVFIEPNFQILEHLEYGV